MSNVVPRDYQREAYEAVQKNIERGIRRNLIVMATGTGKSYTAMFLIEEALKKNKNIIVLVDQEDLVWQWRDYALKIAPNLDVQIEKAEYKAKPTASFVIATVQTLGRKGVKRIEKFDSDHFDKMVVDEAHHSITTQWIRVMEYLGFGDENFHKENELEGYTATGFRSDGKPLSKLYDDVAYQYDIKDAIADGWLVDINTYQIETNTDISDVNVNKGKFNQKQLSQAVDNEERNAQIVKAYKQICDGEKALIYTVDVDHAYDLSEWFSHYDVPNAVIEAETDKTERKKYIQKYRDGKIKALLNYGTLMEGNDFPETKALFLTRPVKSKLPLTQIIGRGLRPSHSAFVDSFGNSEERKCSIERSTKPACKIIDFYDKVSGNPPSHLPSLFGLSEDFEAPEEKKFYKDVVEPLEKVKKEKGIDISKLKSLDDVEIVVKKRDTSPAQYKVDPKIKDMTDRRWLKVDETTYEINYSEDSSILIIEQDESKEELIGREEWNLYEYDTKQDITKHLQTFGSLPGAFNVADQYADRQDYETQFKQHSAEWTQKGVTEKQWDLLMQLYTYKTGYCEFDKLKERYEDTNQRKLRFRRTGEIIHRAEASELISEKFNK